MRNSYFDLEIRYVSTCLQENKQIGDRPSLKALFMRFCNSREVNRITPLTILEDDINTFKSGLFCETVTQA